MSDINPKRKLWRIELDLKDVGLDVSVPSLGVWRPVNDPVECLDESLVEFMTEHVHAQYVMEIHYVAKGRQVWQFSGKDYHVSGGDMFVSMPGERHGLGEHCRERPLTYWLQIRLDFKARSFLGFSKSAARPVLDELLQLGNRSRIFKGSKQVQHLFDEVFAAHKDTKPAMKSIVMSLKLWYLIIEILRCSEHHHAKRKSRDIARVVEYVDEHLEDGTSLIGPVLADMAKLSRSRFQEKFRQEIGMTPSDYVNYRKIERARKLLVAGKHSVTQVAFRLGYDSSQNFATVFKRYTNKRPSDFLP